MSQLPTGRVYGTQLNFQNEVTAWSPEMPGPPCHAPPAAPVLYIKPAHTRSPNGADIALPAQVLQLEVGAAIGLVMGAQGRVAGPVRMNDLSVPNESLFRPPVRFKCLRIA
jgi:5-oxopent-3-ene-1,2,5-tricarboxylate decarboxylase / 2-hydroxyhepta-2,4-diene-1,7-dioate isomerase